MAEEISPLLDHRQTLDLMLTIIEAMGVPHKGRAIRRVTLTLDCEDLATILIEEYPAGAAYVDLKSGFMTTLPRLLPKVVDEGRAMADAAGTQS